MGIKPLLDRVVVEPTKAEEKSAGGIIMAGTDKKAPTQGKVIAVGPGFRSENGTFSPIGVNIGDTVLYSQYGSTEIKLNGTDYLVLSESNILGILD
jgi:chaperonin GroES